MGRIVKRGALISGALGIVATATVAMAPLASASTTAPYIRDGSRGFGVWCVQYALNTQGFHLDEDSKFGPATLAAVKQFQRDTDLPADGIVGPYTGDEIAGADSSWGAPNCESAVPTT
jgi:peptidoglycan hydrolase-like protein with peptidoglycan-binding domain